jgi:LEA14-like dessication related protein
MRPTPQRWLLGILVCTWLSGCAALRLDLEAPVVTLTQIRIVEIGLLSQRFALTLDVQNPNAIELPVAGLRYRLEVDGREVGSGVSPRAFRLAAYDETRIELELTTEAVRLMGLLAEWSRQPPSEVPYALRGEVRLQNLPRTLAFTREGRVPLAMTAR